MTTLISNSFESLGWFNINDKSVVISKLSEKRCTDGCTTVQGATFNMRGELYQRHGFVQ